MRHASTVMIAIALCASPVSGEGSANLAGNAIADTVASPADTTASLADTTAAPTDTTALPADTTAAPADTTAPSWEFYATGYAYFFAHDADFVSLVVTADRGPLHLEARYNYEALETGSFFIGINTGGGETLAFELSLMLGSTIGDVLATVPAYRGALYWRWFDLASEGEYLYDLEVQSDSYFYTWSEIGWTLAGVVRVGLAAQRTQVYETGREFLRGGFAGVSFVRVHAALYLFEPDGDDETFVFTAGLSF